MIALIEHVILHGGNEREKESGRNHRVHARDCSERAREFKFRVTRSRGCRSEVEADRRSAVGAKRGRRERSERGR